MQASANTYSEALYRAAIGPRNADFYVKKFLQFDQTDGPRLSWNWAAFFLAVCWFPYRRLFLPWGLYCLLIPLAMRLVAEIAGSAVGLRIVDLLFDATWLAYSFVVIPLYANTIYWRAIRRRIDSVKRDVADAANQLWVLENRSHTSALWWIPVALVGLTIVGLLAARGIASMARGQVMEGLKLTAPLREAVAKYYATHHSWPATLADLEMSPLRSRYVSDVSLDEGTITIHYAPEGVEEVANQSLSLRPILADHERVRWVCATQMKPVEYVGVELEYLPPGCRPRAGAAAQSKGE